MNKFFSRSLMMLAALAMAMPMVGCSGSPGDVVVGEEMRNADFKEGGEKSDSHLGEELDVDVPDGAQPVN